MARPKSTKTADEFKGREALFSDHLDFYDREENHNKFWFIDLYSPEGSEVVFYVVRRWGRNGTKGGSKVEEFSTLLEADTYAKGLAAKQRRDGYQPDPSLVAKIAREIGDDA
jgi:predicted DNA-binding WGR domain protein